MIEEVDEDGDGNINIVEFLTMMKSKVQHIVKKESDKTANEGPDINVWFRFMYIPRNETAWTCYFQNII
jgi:hypothetical protein